MKKKRKIKRTLRRMKLLALFMLWGIYLCNATTHAQDLRVDLKLSDVSLNEVFDQIKHLTDYMFIYKSEDVKGVEHLHVDVKQTPVREVLNQCLQNTDLSYVLRDNIIIIQKKEEETDKKDIRITGTVTDEKGTTLPGVTITLKGTSIGVTTDEQGKYTFLIPAQENIVLVYSFIGMKSEEIKYAGQETINVVLHEEAQEMQEVVITGYHEIEERYLTSAVNTVKMEDIEVPGLNRLDQMLEGRIPGLTFIQNTGQVGATPKLRIRGSSTLLGNQEPLWVVDGVIQQDPVNVDPAQLNDMDFVNLLGNAISGLNPNDIERIDVLKDASATALYGARAANGVIVITTKMGKIGAPTVSYSVSGTFTQRPRYTDRAFHMMNSKERVDVSRELMEMGVRYNGVYNSTDNWIGYEKAYLDYYMDGSISYEEFERKSQWYETMNTDWLGILTQDVFSNNHSLSINGGSQNVRYYASIGYTDEQGNVRGESNKRYSTSLKLTANYDKLSVQFGVNGSVTKKKYNPTELNVMSYAHSMSRAIPLRGEDDELWYYKRDNKTYSSFNIINEMNNSSRDIDQNSFTVRGQMQYKFTPSFKLLGTASYTFNYTNEEEWFGENSDHVRLLRDNRSYSRDLCPFGGTFETATTRNNSYTLRLQADYTKHFGKEKKHFGNAMFGYELSSSEYNAVSEEIRGYFKDRGKSVAQYSISKLEDFEKYYAFYKWKINNNPNYSDQLTNLMSGYMTLTYGYDDRYILNFNMRADWSNAFGSRSNDEFFPIWSVSGRWNISNDVLKEAEWVDNLALRLSYGLQGNMLNTQPTRLIINKGDYDDALGGFVSTINNYPNPDLKWEKTHSYNVGLDFSFWQGKVNGTFAFFYKKTKDAFLTKKVASQNGITSYTINAGNVENKGVEIALQFKVIDNALAGNSGKRGFTWRIDPQIGQTLNRLINNAISRNNKVLQDAITMDDLLNGSAYIAGTPLNTIFSFRYDGLDNTGRPTFKGLEESRQDELNERYLEMALDDKRDVWLEILGKSGSRVPDIQGGLNNYLAYRNFSLSFNLAYSIGNKIRMFRLCSGNYSAVNPQPHMNLRKEFVDRWRYPGDEKNTDIPGLRTAVTVNGNTSDMIMDKGWWFSKSWWNPNSSRTKYNMYDNSDLRVVRGDYLRLQSLSFRYKFEEKLLQRVGLTDAYISLSATNLFTICDKRLKGQNPEQSGTSDMVNISLRPTYSFSLNINF